MHLKYIELLEKRINQLEVLVNKPAEESATANGGQDGKTNTDDGNKVSPSQVLRGVVIVSVAD